MEVAHKMLILELLSYFVLNYVKLYTIITYAYIGNMDINRGQPLNGGIKVNWGDGMAYMGSVIVCGLPRDLITIKYKVAALFYF